MALSEEESGAYNALFGEEDGTGKDQSQTADEEAGSEEEEDDSNGSEADKNAESDESEDEDDSESEEEEEKKPRKGDPQVPLRALRKEVSDLKSESDSYRRMLQDEQFLEQQLARVKKVKQSGHDSSQDTGKDGQRSDPTYVPEAPYYRNTPEGRTDMRLDIHEAIRIMPELETDKDLGDMVEAMVANSKNPISFIQAVQKVKSRLEGSKTQGKSESEKESKESRKENLSKAPRPGTGSPSRQQQLEKASKSSDKRTSERAQAELLGLI